MAEYKKEHLRDHIKAQPLAAVQEAFVTRASAGTMNEAARDELIHRLETAVPDEMRTRVLFEERNVDEALKTGKAPRPPSIATPETSLLWAINLAYLAQKNKNEFYNGALWKQFTNSTDGAAQNEKEGLAFYLATAGVTKDTRLGWGELGTSFYYNPQENRVNLDLILAMGVGFDVSRAAAFHEMGHSQLTKGFGEKIEALKQETKTLKQQCKGRKASDDEYKKLKRLEAETEFRYLITDEAENNPVDRWTVNQGARIRKDHIYARNATEAILVDGLLAKNPKTQEDTPYNRFRNVKSAIRNSFFRNNGYFPDTEQGWRAMGVNPDLITTKDGKSGMEALDMLKGMCAEVENLQPKPEDMMSGAIKLAATTLDYSKKRTAKIDEIYDTFVAHVVEPIIEQKQEQLDQQMQQKQQGQGQQQEQGESQGGEGEGQGESDGQSQGQGQGEGQNQGQGNSESKDQKQSGGEEGQSQGKREGDEEDSGQKQGEKDGKGAGQGEEKSSGGQDDAGDEPEPIEVEGVGEMPGIKELPDDPQEAHNAGKPGADKSSKDKASDEGQTIEELEKAREARKNYSDGNNDPSQNAPPSSSANQGFRTARGIGASNLDSAPQIGDWSDYQAMVSQFAAEIGLYQGLIDQLRARQLEQENKLSPGLSLLPEDGDMRRLDRGAHAHLVKKILRGQMPSEEDTYRFRTDQKQSTPGNIDIVFLLDGSGSMHSSMSAKGGSWPFAPIKVGMHTGCILNEACKDDVLASRHANFYMGLWGNAKPLMLVRPGDDPREIGKRIAGLTVDQNWGTSLAPSIRHITAELAEHQKNRLPTKTGYSHFIVLSDGGIGDENASFQTITKLLDNCPLSSVDFVIIENGKTEMDKLAKKLESAYPGRVGVHHFNSPALANDGIETLLRERIENTPITPSITSEQKRASLMQAHQVMTGGR